MAILWGFGRLKASRLRDLQLYRFLVLQFVSGLGGLGFEVSGFGGLAFVIWGFGFWGLSGILVYLDREKPTFVRFPIMISFRSSLVGFFELRSLVKGLRQ